MIELPKCFIQFLLIDFILNVFNQSSKKGYAKYGKYADLQTFCRKEYLAQQSGVLRNSFSKITRKYVYFK